MMLQSFISFSGPKVNKHSWLEVCSVRWISNLRPVNVIVAGGKLFENIECFHLFVVENGKEGSYEMGRGLNIISLLGSAEEKLMLKADFCVT